METLSIFCCCFVDSEFPCVVFLSAVENEMERLGRFDASFEACEKSKNETNLLPTRN